MYLGKQHDNQYVFYTCAAAYLAFDDCDEYTLANYEVQVKYISEVCKALLGLFMLHYEMCLAPAHSDKKYHNFKLFMGDTVMLYLTDGSRPKGIVICFRQDGIVLDDIYFYPLDPINDIGFITRGDKGTNYK